MVSEMIENSISQQIWDMKYRLKDENGAPVDVTVEDSWRRVAKAAAKAEKKSKREFWEREFYNAMKGFQFLPAGRILAGAGTARKVTLFNCYVMGEIEDDMSSIFDHVKSAALTLQQGGGIGQDFSSLRPKGAYVKGVGADASGPVSFMNIWDSMCRTIMSAGTRRGAMMATLRCDHPDIELFINAKKDPNLLRMFNLSVLVTDDFMEAVREDKDFPLKFEGKIYKSIKARALWDQIMQSNYQSAEPGVIFIDRINKRNNLNYCETIYATNPCGEQPLPPHGACLLGSINLAHLVDNAFEDGAVLNEEKLKKLVATSVRFLDNIIDISNFPLKEQKKEAKNKRRIGLGITGLADALIQCGITYGSKEAQELAAKWMKLIANVSYETSCKLAQEKGCFPLYQEDAFLQSPIFSLLDKQVCEDIKTHGIRNGLVTSIAPTGTISLFAGNVSSGIEPVFDFSYERKIRHADDTTETQTIDDYAYRLFREKFGDDAELPSYFITAQDLKPEEHIAMQAAVQPFVDSAISKTINCPEDISFEAYKDLYTLAYKSGLKGCTTYRPNPITGSVLSTKTEKETEAKPDVLPAGQNDDQQVIYMSAPLERDEVLSGSTYKLKWPGSDHAIYITINDIIQDGRKRPFEIFINSKNLDHYAWTVALTRMISAVFRRGGDISFVHEELKAIFDPRGGKWVHRQYIPSLQAAIGNIIEKHMHNINFLGSDSEPDTQEALYELEINGDATISQVEYCSNCSSQSLVYQNGCKTCYNCGKSECN